MKLVGTIRIDITTFEYNIAQIGGAIFIGEQGVTLIGSMIVSNEATFGGAIATAATSKIDFIRNNE